MHQISKILKLFVLFALFILPGGKCLSSASAQAPTYYPWKFQCSNGVYTDTLYQPYNNYLAAMMALCPYPAYYPMIYPNPAQCFQTGGRMDDDGQGAWISSTVMWVPGALPPVLGPDAFASLGANTYTASFGHWFFTANGTPDEVVSATGTVNLIDLTTCTLNQQDMITTSTCDIASITVGTSITFQCIPNLDGPNDEVRWTVLSGEGAFLYPKPDYKACDIWGVKTGTLRIRCTYLFDGYDSGSWDWEETIPYSAYDVPRMSVSKEFSIQVNAYTPSSSTPTPTPTVTPTPTPTPAPIKAVYYPLPPDTQAYYTSVLGNTFPFDPPKGKLYLPINASTIGGFAQDNHLFKMERNGQMATDAAGQYVGEVIQFDRYWAYYDANGKVLTWGNKNEVDHMSGQEAMQITTGGERMVMIGDSYWVKENRDYAIGAVDPETSYKWGAKCQTWKYPVHGTALCHGVQELYMGGMPGTARSGTLVGKFNEAISVDFTLTSNTITNVPQCANSVSMQNVVNAE